MKSFGLLKAWPYLTIDDASAVRVRRGSNAGGDVYDCRASSRRPGRDWERQKQRLERAMVCEHPTRRGSHKRPQPDRDAFAGARGGIMDLGVQPPVICTTPQSLGRLKVERRVAALRTVTRRAAISTFLAALAICSL